MGRGRRQTLTAVVAVTAALAGANGWVARRRPDLPAPVDAAPQSLSTPEGTVRFYAQGDGPPLLLLHSFNAAASAYEMRPLFQRLAVGRRVITFDWLGFGLSQRPPLHYSAETYRRLLHYVMDALTPGRVDVVALSLPGQYVALAAAAHPERFGRLVLISPTGLLPRSRLAPLLGAPAAAVLRAPLVGQAIYNGITSRPAIRTFLRDLFADPGLLPAGYEHYAWATARQPGARWAPASFVAGLLNAGDAASAYRQLRTPALLLFGDHPRFSDPAGAYAAAAANPHLTVQVLAACGDLPHVEQPGITADAVRAFIREAAPTA